MQRRLESRTTQTLLHANSARLRMLTQSSVQDQHVEGGAHAGYEFDLVRWLLGTLLAIGRSAWEIL